MSERSYDNQRIKIINSLNDKQMQVFQDQSKLNLSKSNLHRNKTNNQYSVRYRYNTFQKDHKKYQIESNPMNTSLTKKVQKFHLHNIKITNEFRQQKNKNKINQQNIIRKTQYNYQQVLLQQQARKFILKIKKQKQYIRGKALLKKQQQQAKKRNKQKISEIQTKLKQNYQIRLKKLKVEENLILFKDKAKQRLNQSIRQEYNRYSRCKTQNDYLIQESNYRLPKISIITQTNKSISQNSQKKYFSQFKESSVIKSLRQRLQKLEMIVQNIIY